jgi:hypothetical protein
LHQMRPGRYLALAEGRLRFGIEADDRCSQQRASANADFSGLSTSVMSASETPRKTGISLSAIAGD